MRIISSSKVDLSSRYAQGDKWLSKAYTSVGVASYQIAVTNIFKNELGLTPDFCMGHSLGETATGYANGMQSEQETIGIAWVRGQLSKRLRAGYDMLKLRASKKVPESYHDFVEDADLVRHVDSAETDAAPSSIAEEKFAYYYVKRSFHDYVKDNLVSVLDGEFLFDLAGQMSVVGLPAGFVSEKIATLNLKETVVACLNSPEGQTVSGPKRELGLLKEALLREIGEKLFWRDLDTDGVAYHAPHMGCHYEFLVEAMRKVMGSSRRVWNPTWVSTSCGPASSSSSDAPKESRPRMPQPKIFDCHYHARNITNPVWFTDAVNSLPPATMILEVGSSQSLLTQIKRTRKDVGLLGFAKNDKPETEVFYAHPEKARVALWESGYLGAFTTCKPPLFRKKVSKQTRLPLEKRFPFLWNHSVAHRVLTWEDFAHMQERPKEEEPNCSPAGCVVKYDIANADKYLLDHQINGRCLFPATGHIWTMWQALDATADGGLELSDYEILQAVMLDAKAEPVVKFTVQVMGEEFSSSGRGTNLVQVMYNGQCVARAKCSKIDHARSDEKGGGTTAFEQDSVCRSSPPVKGEQQFLTDEHEHQKILSRK